MRRLRGHEIAIGALVATAFWALILVLTSDSASHYEVCETSKEGAKECANYNVIGFTFRKIGASIDMLGALITAAATVAIAWFTYTLRRSTDQLRESGEKQIRISGQMTEVAERQLTITGLQTDIQQKQHAIGRLQFIAAHRPRLLIRHIEISSAFSEQFTVLFSHGAKISGRLTVVNAGGSTAHIVTSEHRIFAAKDGLPIRPPYDTRSPNLLDGGQSLDVGEACECTISDTLIMPFDERLGRPTNQFSDEGWSLYVMGRISYMDDGGAERFMAFCRQRGSDGRFTAVKDSDYEYED